MRPGLEDASHVAPPSRPRRSRSRHLSLPWIQLASGTSSQRFSGTGRTQSSGPERGPCELSTCRRIFAQIGQTMVETVPCFPNPCRSWRKWGRAGPKWVDLGRLLAKCTQSQDNVGKHQPLWPGIDRIWADFNWGRIRSTNICREIAKLTEIDEHLPESTKVGSHSTRFGPKTATFGQLRSVGTEFDQAWPDSTHIGLGYSGQLCSDFGQIWPLREA